MAVWLPAWETGSEGRAPSPVDDEAEPAPETDSEDPAPPPPLEQLPAGGDGGDPWPAPPGDPRLEEPVPFALHAVR